MQERAIEEVKLAIKPFYQKRDINKDEYKEILRKAVQKVGSRPGSARLRLPTPNGSSASPWSSHSTGVSQQERRDQPSEGGQPGQGLRGQIQTRQETQERRRLRKDAGRSISRQPMTTGTLTSPRVAFIFWPERVLEQNSFRFASSFQVERRCVQQGGLCSI